MWFPPVFRVSYTVSQPDCKNDLFAGLARNAAMPESTAALFSARFQSVSGLDKVPAPVAALRATADDLTVADDASIFPRRRCDADVADRAAVVRLKEEQVAAFDVGRYP
jgi:hypothetical protein